MSKLKLTEGVKAQMEKFRRPPAQDELGCGIEARVLPKENIVVLPEARYRERDGKKFAVHPTDGTEAELPIGSEVVLEGAPIDPSQLDVVLFAFVSLIKKSILLHGNRAPAANVTMAELGRIPLDVFLSRADAIFEKASTK